jgi:hypothetical protein
MALSIEAMTLGDLKTVLNDMDADDSLMVRVSVFGDRPISIFSVRKNVETDEDNEVTDAFIVFNG